MEFSLVQFSFSGPFLDESKCGVMKHSSVRQVQNARKKFVRLSQIWRDGF
jgi:hypothetical protein